MMASAGAAYMTIESDDAISIVSAAVPEEVAGTVELHENVAVEGTMGEGSEGMDEGAMAEGGDTEGDGMEEPMDMPMTMREVASIDVPAGGSVSLAPGGLHVMLLDLPDPLELGETFDLVLTTAEGDEITVPVEVRSEAP